MNGRKTHPSETEEQEGFVNWFRTKFSGVLIFAIPNGGHRAISTAKRLKAEGVVSGIPDLHVPAWRLWVEMKRVKGGKLSAEQEAMILHLEGLGHKVVVGKGAEDASAQIVEWIKAHKK
jgi:VRR-NUC domain.